MTVTGFAEESMNPGWAVARYLCASRTSAIARTELSPGYRKTIDAYAVGLTLPEYERATRGFSEHVEAVATDMLEDEWFAGAVAALPLSRGDHVVALGDSITADSCSWAEILDAVLRTTDRGVRVTNHGISGDTTTNAIERIDLVAAARPQWVVQLLGTNDTRRHGTRTGARIVSLEESMRNFAVLEDLITHDVGASLIRMTPTSIVSSRVAQWQPFRAKGIVWHAEDMDELAMRLRELDPDAVDLHALTTGAAAQTLVRWDGVHPTVAGQQAILRALVSRMTAGADASSSRSGKERGISPGSTGASRTDAGEERQS